MEKIKLNLEKRNSKKNFLSFCNINFLLKR